VHDGKSYKEVKYRKLLDMVDDLPAADLIEMEKELEQAYTKSIMAYEGKADATEE
jgi:hypothetical protein